MRNFLVGLFGSVLVCAAGLGAVSHIFPQRVTLAAAPVQNSAQDNAAQTAPVFEPASQPQAAPPAPSAPAEGTPAPAAKPEPMLDPAPPVQAAPPVQTAPPLAAPVEPAPSQPAPPQIAPPAPADAAPTPQAAPAPPTSTPPSTQSAPQDLGAPLLPQPLAPTSQTATPLSAYAAQFAGAANKPLFAIVLLDTGAPDVDRAALASLPFPITFAVDPDADTAIEAMTLYRAAGKEVVIYANSLPSGASAQDIAKSFSVYSAVLPETVAVMSPPQGGFQDDRALADQVLQEIAAGGRGVVLVQKGLNSAGQIAERTGIPYASISRILDVADESVPVMRRYLDRAVFAAAQDGMAIVMGSTLPDTITALTEWAIEGRASDVTLAPISATFQR